MTAKLEHLTLEVLPHGIVAPLTSLAQGGGGKKGSFDGGVYYRDGSVCANALQAKPGFVNEPLPIDSSESLPLVSGKHVFGGMLKNEHFGHFLAESLSRIWAIAVVTASIDSIVVYKRLPGHDVPRWAKDILSILAPSTQLTIVSEPTAFETLLIPGQIADADYGFIYGHPLLRDALAPFRQIPGKSFDKLYVSRSRVEPAQGSFLGENRLEEILTREGFHIFHPQEYSIYEQVSFFNGASKIVFAEGTAVHLFALACRPDQSVYIIQRRRKSDIDVLVSQLTSFGCVPHFGPEEPAQYLVPERNGRSYNGARARIDFEKLRAQMADIGLVSESEWIVPIDEDITEEIASIETSLGQRLIEHSAVSLHGLSPDLVLDDLAFGKPAMSSSTGPWSKHQNPERDACGANSESIAQDYGFHTGGETNPWWKVDLLEEDLIEEIAIVNRRSFPERFSTFRIDSSCDGAVWIERMTQSSPVEVGSEIDWPYRIGFPEPFLARHVRITLLGPGPLHLRRVQIFSAGSSATGKRLIARMLTRHDPREFFEEKSELREALMNLTDAEDIVCPLRRAFAESRDHRSIALLHEQAALYALPLGLTADDVALYKPARSSSVTPWSSYRDTERDACGANTERIAEDYGFHTGGEVDPWWRVDLLQEYEVDEVAIVNRQRCSERFSKFCIESSCDGDDWTTRWMQVEPVTVSSDLASPWRMLASEPFTARFIRIVLLGAGPLHLRRVQVFSTAKKRQMMSSS